MALSDRRKAAFDYASDSTKQLIPRATTFFIDWDESADASVAVPRAEAGRNPRDQELTNLIGKLSTRSEDLGSQRYRRHR